MAIPDLKSRKKKKKKKKSIVGRPVLKPLR